MDKNLEELQQKIISCAESGKISDSDMQMLTIQARMCGLSSDELDVLIQKLLGNMNETPKKTFEPKITHILMAVAAVVMLSVLIYISIDIGGSKNEIPNSYKGGLRDLPIGESDLFHIYSGSYDGKTILLTVKDMKNENGVCVLTFDIKCEFVTVANGCKCYVDLENCTYKFEDNEDLNRKINLDKGSIQRTAAGKVVLRPVSGLYELVQL